MKTQSNVQRTQTLAVLIHWALWRAHSRVWWAHAGALHGSTVDIFHNPLVMYAIHRLKHAKAIY